jgi:hypothetical protein
MQIGGSMAPPTREVFKTGDTAVIDGLMPAALVSRADVKTSLENTLRNQHLMTVNQNLYTSCTLGNSADPAGWGWWPFSPNQSNGSVFSARGQVYSAGALIADVPGLEQHRIRLYPLDLIHGGSADRYAHLLANGQRWSELVFDMTTRQSVGAASGALLMRHWLTADLNGHLDPLAIPAASIVLHGMADYFSRPSVEAFTVDPVVFNRDEMRRLPFGVTMNMPVDEVEIEVLDASGNLVKLDNESTSITLIPGSDRRNMANGF